MKLSDAIREGAKKRPQAKQAFFDFDNYECLGSCVLGAAYEGYTGTYIPEGQLKSDSQVLNTIATYAEIDIDQEVKLPTGGPLADIYPLWRVMADLNDYQWTREQIADWLAELGL